MPKLSQVESAKGRNLKLLASEWWRNIFKAILIVFFESQKLNIYINEKISMFYRNKCEHMFSSEQI